MVVEMGETRRVDTAPHLINNDTRDGKPQAHASWLIAIVG
jgi:hypothetical protein